jgi:PTH1 family peptidyl-tRNA hydrolase
MQIHSFNSKLLRKYSNINWEDFVLALEKVFEQDISVNIVFVKEKYIKKLNNEFRNINNVTDVLSFPLSNTSEIYICPRYINRVFKKDKFTQEIMRVSIHGILHLLGYDHKGKFEKDSQEEMFKIQEKKLEEVLNLLKKKMYLLVGLGNPGEEYENNRHNAGYMALDRLEQLLTKKDFQTTGWKKEKIFNSDINTFEKDNVKIVLLKPLTFMNNSGVAVKKALRKYSLEDMSKELILIHDDLDIPLGQYKTQMEKAPKCHNGVKNVEDHLGTNKFKRVRIGVDSRDGKNIPGEKYVLMDFSEEEKVSLFEAIDCALEELLLNLN